MKWIHREEVLLGKQMKTQTPEGEGLEWQAKKIKACSQSAVSARPLTT